MKRFIKADPGPRNSVIYSDEDGNQVVFSGGDRNWRNNNPGNLVPGHVSKRNGQIGVAGGFAVFPDSEAGHNALIDSLKNTFGNKNLEEMIEKYAPKGENNTDLYLRFLRKKTGVTGKKKIKDFSLDEFENLWRAIESMEGKKRPTMKPVEKKAAKASSPNRCPRGQHWVKAHAMKVPPSKTYPQGRMTTRRGHCAKNPSVA